MRLGVTVRRFSSSDRLNRGPPGGRKWSTQPYGERGSGVAQQWFYSPSAGEICIDVTNLHEDSIRLVHKAIETEFVLADGVEIMFDECEGTVHEWWIYKGTER